MERIPALDTAKAVGILCIIATHVNQIFHLSAYALGTWAFVWVDRFFYVLGYYGVSLFIVASGFGMTFSLLRKKNVNWREWAKKRLLKIYIPFWISYIFFLLFFTIGPDITSVIPTKIIGAKEFLLTFVGVQAYAGMWGGVVNQVYWFNTLILSLSVVFPILYYLVRKQKNVQLLIVSALVSFVSMLAIMNVSWLFSRVLFTGYLFEFVVGMVLAQRLYLPGNVVRNRVLSMLSLAVLAMIFIVYVSHLGNIFTTLMAITGGPLLFLAFLYGSSATSGILSKVTKYIADYSHELFLYHLPFLALYSNTQVSPIVFGVIYIIGLVLIVLCARRGEQAFQYIGIKKQLE